MRDKIFGTDGIRGRANEFPLDPETIVKIGRAAAYVFGQQEQKRHRIVIGKDTRISGYILESALSAGICSMGSDVVLVGPLPTPGISFITRSLRADVGIVLSASHNHFEDNGIKFFSAQGLKLPDKVEREIAEMVFSEEIEKIRPYGEHVGKAFRIEDACGRYIEFVKNTFPRGMMLDGLKIVLDCANGAAYKAAPMVLTELDAEVIVINHEPDGININQGCGATDTKMLQARVKAEKADIGIALDGDGDRLMCVDEKGNEIDGDSIIGICAIDLLSTKKLKNNLVITTVMSNLGLEKSLTKHGVKVIRTDVGDRYVMEAMIKYKAILGGEPSGHMIFKEYNPTGDGLISALQVLKIIKQRKECLSKLAGEIKKFPQVLKNIKVSKRVPLEQLPGVQQKLKVAQKALGDTGRVLIRYSGTEKKVRVMVEGENLKQIQAIAEQLGQEFEIR